MHLPDFVGATVLFFLNDIKLSSSNWNGYVDRLGHVWRNKIFINETFRYKPVGLGSGFSSIG
ncbi:hypothetical protein BLOT_001344 [Blomia tropicalis]|nr:hypothetical protein BLOT_001344 [Blomia tropicalis]